MKIFFKHPGGQCELENVEPYDTVSLIRRRLSEISGMAESEIFIATESNKLLDDDYTLEDYEIENEAVLRIEIKGRGNTFKFSDMKNKITVLTRKAIMTDMNKHTFILDGVNLRGTCSADACSIKEIP